MTDTEARDAASKAQVRDMVRAHYAEVARSDGACGCGPGCCSPAAAASVTLGYDAAALASLPAGADMGLGCGTPLSFAALQDGEAVLDLGSGGGIDCLLAARQVGPGGSVVGVDMTPEMVSKARGNAARAAAHNVEFRLGEIERLPVADRTVDVVVSNCVINLSPDKRAVFGEAFRVLRPGGRLAIADIVASAPLPRALQEDAGALAGCIAGAPSLAELEEHLRAAGFVEVNIEVQERSRQFIKDWAPGSGAEGFVASAHITARRPQGAGCCGTTPGAASCC
jgi:SAM-dependent methyltransferase